MTREELKSIPNIDKMIRYKLEELRELEELSTCVPALQTKEKVQTSVQNKSMDIVVKIADFKREIEKDYNRLIELKKEAYSLIQNLEGKEKILMDLRYIGGKEWQEIAYLLGWSYRHTTRVHGEILKKIFEMS